MTNPTNPSTPGDTGIPDLADIVRSIVIQSRACDNEMDYEHGAFAENNPKLHKFISQFHDGLRMLASDRERLQAQSNAYARACAKAVEMSNAFERERDRLQEALTAAEGERDAWRDWAQHQEGCRSCSEDPIELRDFECNTIREAAHSTPASTSTDREVGDG